MRNQILIFLLTILSTTIFSQTNSSQEESTHSDWKKVLIYHSFDVTKKKENIPTWVLKKIDIDSISEIANPKEKWTSSCNPVPGLPREKLNWAAFIPDKIAWVLSITRGGYSATTTYYLIDSSCIETIRNSGWTGEKFEGFKTKYLNGTQKRSLICRHVDMTYLRGGYLLLTAAKRKAAGTVDRKANLLSGRRRNLFSFCFANKHLYLHRNFLGYRHRKFHKRPAPSRKTLGVSG